jgi:hypothetical protein
MVTVPAVHTRKVNTKIPARLIVSDEYVCVARAQLVCSYQRAAAPFESLSCEFTEGQIRHKAAVSTVAVREHTNGDEEMMVAGSNLYGRVPLAPPMSSMISVLPRCV